MRRQASGRRGGRRRDRAAGLRHSRSGRRPDGLPRQRRAPTVAGTADVEPTGANGANAACATDARQSAAVAPVGPLSLAAPTAVTRREGGILAASAGVAQVNPDLGGLPVAVAAVSVSQMQSCASVSTAGGSANVDALTIAGLPVNVIGGRTIDLTVAGIRVRTNVASGDTRQPWSWTPAAPGSSSARPAPRAMPAPRRRTARQSGTGSAGTVSDSGATDTSGATATVTATDVCPDGSTYRVTDDRCVILANAAGGNGTSTLVIGRPYTGPSGGRVISLTAAHSLVASGKLHDGVCLHGTGSAYAVLGNGRGDRLTGTNRGDRILGLGGADHIDGGRGADCIDGGTGADTLTGGEGDDRAHARPPRGGHPVIA